MVLDLQKANTYQCSWGSVLGSREVEVTRSNLDWLHEPFHFSDGVKLSNEIIAKLTLYSKREL